MHESKDCSLLDINHRDLERPNGVNNEDLVHMPSITTVVCIVVIDGIWTKSSLFYPVRAFQVPMI